jgi:hypothetical protein
VVRAALLAALCASSLARAAPEIFIEAELSPARVYVGGEARLVLRLFRAPHVAAGTLKPPVLGETGELSILAVRTYEAEHAGVAYQVLERANSIVPRRAGRLVVPGAEFESGRYFAEQFGRYVGRPRVVRGPEASLEVLAPPPGAGEPFLPARSLALRESWSRDLDALSTGVPVTRTLVLEAEGLAAERLPRLEMSGNSSLRVHHDLPELATAYSAAGMVGRRLQRIVLMPVSEGEVVLPELSVRWWDVGADAARVATLPGRTLRLHPAIAPTAAPAPAPAGVSPRTVLRGFVLALGWYLRTQALRDLRARLRAACRANHAREARDALLEWQGAARTPPAWDAAARDALAALDAALYGARAWDGRAFWRAVRPCLKSKRTRRAAPKAPLPPLFRLQAPTRSPPG